MTPKKTLDRIRAKIEADKLRGGGACITCGLPTDVLAMVRELSKQHPLARIARHLRAEGFVVKDQAFREHFREHEQR